MVRRPAGFAYIQLGVRQDPQKRVSCAARGEAVLSSCLSRLSQASRWPRSWKTPRCRSSSRWGATGVPPTTHHHPPPNPTPTPSHPQVISLSLDKSGAAYISTLEGRNYPFTATQVGLPVLLAATAAWVPKLALHTSCLAQPWLPQSVARRRGPARERPPRPASPRPQPPRDSPMAAVAPREERVRVDAPPAHPALNGGGELGLPWASDA